VRDMRDLTADESEAVDRLFKIVEERCADLLLLLLDRGDPIFNDWAVNLLYVKNEDTSFGDHMHLACMETADRYDEATTRMCDRAGLERRAILPMLVRTRMMSAGSRLVALKTGLIRDEDIPDCISEIETAVREGGLWWAEIEQIDRADAESRVKAR
jgi:hypothetical protein